MFKSRKYYFLFVIIIIAFSWFAFSKTAPEEKPKILLYHSVVPTPDINNKLCISVRMFERQMWFLRKFHYNVISLEKLGEWLRKDNQIPARTVVITFDDGFKDNYLYVFPIIKKYGILLTIFVIVNEISKGPDRLSWEEMEEMQKSELVTFGSHSLSHNYLTAMDEAGLRKEIFESKRILEARLKRPVKSFAYPYGDFNNRIRNMVKDAGYKLAVLVLPVNKNEVDDLYSLRRMAVYSMTDNLLGFWLKTSGHFDFLWWSLVGEESKEDCFNPRVCK